LRKCRRRKSTARRAARRSMAGARSGCRMGPPVGENAGSAGMGRVRRRSTGRPVGENARNARTGFVHRRSMAHAARVPAGSVAQDSVSRPARPRPRSVERAHRVSAARRMVVRVIPPTRRSVAALPAGPSRDNSPAAPISVPPWRAVRPEHGIQTVLARSLIGLVAVTRTRSCRAISSIKVS
jgi:hypothetical protein